MGELPGDVPMVERDVVRLVVLDARLTVVQTYVGGQLAYSRTA